MLIFKSIFKSKTPPRRKPVASNENEDEFSMQVEYSEAKRNSVSWKLVSATPKTPIEGLDAHSSANAHIGRQIWMCEDKKSSSKRVAETRAAYQESSETIRHSADEVYRSQCEDKRTDAFTATQDTSASHIQRVGKALSSAAKYVCSLQEPDGHWPGDYGGPMFLLPGQY
jgi:cycloartenol synthase